METQKNLQSIISFQFQKVDMMASKIIKYCVVHAIVKKVISMPDRILRDTTDSERVNSVSINAELMMYRLFMKADDFGSYYANPKLIKKFIELNPSVLSQRQVVDIIARYRKKNVR